MKVTRIAYSRDLNEGKYGQLVEQARRLGRVRSLAAGPGLQHHGSLPVWRAKHPIPINTDQGIGSRSFPA